MPSSLVHPRAWQPRTWHLPTSPEGCRLLEGPSSVILGAYPVGEAVECGHGIKLFRTVPSTDGLYGPVLGLLQLPVLRALP